MSNIDEVIARSRQPGGFSERKQFSVARERAIRKMREFALADPHYYVLELIQAAIANKADHVDMRIDADTFVLSYIGGGFSEAELSQIFDFLFASKTDVNTGDIRQLALGINALMRFKPRQIILESGDGTLAGTTRVEINQRRNMVEVGTPETALNGTFLRAQGLRRGGFFSQNILSSLEYRPPEAAAIESRCLTAPIPILVNGSPVFGYATMRTPRLLGYDQVIEFDEGDLYGSIGVARQPHNEIFKLLTWGVWIQSVEFPLVEGKGFGGIVTFDRLNKTADHAAIVQDERFEELWARLRPYARMALSTEPGARAFQVRHLDAGPLTSVELRALARAHKVLVTVGADVDPNTPLGARARQFGQTLNAPVLRVSDDDFKTFNDLVRLDAHVLRPALEDSEDLRLLTAPIAPRPARPWLLGPLVIDPIDVDEALEQIEPGAGARLHGLGHRRVQRLDEVLGGADNQLASTVFTPQTLPADATPGSGAWARLRVAGRVIWEGMIDTPYPGHVIDIQVPARSPSALLRPSPFDKTQTLAESIAQMMVNRAQNALEDANSRVLQQLQKDRILPGTSGAHIALAALARNSIMQLRSADDAQSAAQIRFDLFGAANAHNLEQLPLFNTLDGRQISLRDLESIMRHTHGLVYGTIPQVPANLDGLDRSRILALDPQSEALLSEIVGHGAYIRVDSRDILAESGDGRWQVRDLASGLREYPQGALLLEGDGARAGETPGESVIAGLVSSLKVVRLAILNEASGAEDKEARRQATRHLQYFICTRRATRPDLPTYGVEDLGLFLDEQLQAVSLRQVCEGFKAHDTLVMLDGRAATNSHPSAALGATGLPRALMLNPWSFHLLRPLGTLVGALDVAPNAARLAESSRGDWAKFDALIVAREVDTPVFKGRIGLSTTPVSVPVIRVISADRRRVSLLRQASIDCGIIGTIELKKAPDNWNNALVSVDVELRRESVRLLHSALDQLPSLETTEHLPIILRTLFDFAGRHLQLSATAHGPIQPTSAGTDQERALADRILRTPFFPTHHGVPVSGMRLLQQACVERHRGEKLDPSTRLELTDATPSLLVEWLEFFINRIKTTPPPTPRPTPPPRQAKEDPQPADHHPSLAGRLEQLLRHLRPDSHAAQTLHTRIVFFDPAGLDPAARDLPWAVRAGFEQINKKPPFIYIDDQASYLLVNRQNPLTQRAIDASPGDDTPIAWLLLAAYAHINAVLEPVTNDHELTFQRRVLDALKTGALSPA